MAAIIRSKNGITLLEGLVADACDRVRTREHTVVRDNDFFIRSRRERRGQL